MIKPKKLNLGDTIGVAAPSSPIIGDNIYELNKAKEIIENLGFKVKYSKNIFSNSTGYCATARERASDINELFENEEVKMIWCAKGGDGSSEIFEYLDYDLIKKNPKIVCGFSDITSITNVITLKTGLVTFSGTNFKTVATDETDFSLKEVIKRFVEGDANLGLQEDEYKIINEGFCEGELIGGNISLMSRMTCGKYSLDFNNKILFIEDLGLSSDPEVVASDLYYMKQNEVFDKIKGLWIGNYEHESKIELEKIVLDVLENEYNFPIIKSNNFGHIENKIVIPIGVKARIDTKSEKKIELLENCIID